MSLSAIQPLGRWVVISCLAVLLAKPEPSLAEGGAFNGGGGGAGVICRDANRKIVSAQLLDLFEGPLNFGYNIVIDMATRPKQQILRAIQGIESQYEATLINEAVAQVVSVMSFLPAGVGFAAPPDLGRDFGVPVLDGCAPESIGYYQKNGSLKVSREAWAKLDDTNRAAFILHEAIYKLARETSGAMDSAASRQVTASLFASNVSAQEKAELLKEVLYHRDSFNRFPALQRIINPKPARQFVLTINPNFGPRPENFAVHFGPFNSIKQTIDFNRRRWVAGGTSPLAITYVPTGAREDFAVDFSIWQSQPSELTYAYELRDEDGRLLAAGVFQTKWQSNLLFAFTHPMIIGELPEPQ